MCGVLGVIGPKASAEEVRTGLLLLQHRGQDSAGILCYDEEEKKFHLHKALGQVAAVFGKGLPPGFNGSLAIGHTRYSTIGIVKETDIQPMALAYPVGVGGVHNGNLVNMRELRQAGAEKGITYLSDNDLEVILHLFSSGWRKSEGDNFERLCLATNHVMDKVKGGYSVVATIAGLGMFAFRDPEGIRPLAWGEKTLEGGKMAYAVASESTALDFLGYKLNGDLNAGEVIWFPLDGAPVQRRRLVEHKKKSCYFEWVYFASAETKMEGREVYVTRLKLGERLATRLMDSDEEFDLVTCVPDTGRSAAIRMSEILRLPFREVFMKNRYVQRSFILNSQDKRKLAVRSKFNVVHSQVEGRKILVVDDSLVRGTTSIQLVKLLYQSGAKEVHMAFTCPKIIAPCYYGIDFPDPKELIARGVDNRTLAEMLGAKSVTFLEVEDLKEVLGSELCLQCVTGVSPHENT